MILSPGRHVCPRTGICQPRLTYTYPDVTDNLSGRTRAEIASRIQRPRVSTRIRRPAPEHEGEVHHDRHRSSPKHTINSVPENKALASVRAITRSVASMVSEAHSIPMVVLDRPPGVRLGPVRTPAAAAHVFVQAAAAGRRPRSGVTTVLGSRHHRREMLVFVSIRAWPRSRTPADPRGRADLSLRRRR
jgi:hypothetical protein